MTPLPSRWFRFALVSLVGALLPPAANALILTDTESLDSYAGLATVTVSRHGPTPSATRSGTASAGTTFVMAWMGGDNDYAHSLAVASSVPSFAIDFGSMLAGSAPSSLGKHVFNLALAPVVLDVDELPLAGPFVGDVASVLALAEGADDRASWADDVTQGIFTATYRLFLFHVSGGGTSSSGSWLSDANVETNVETNVEINRVPEPGLLALIGIGLAGLAVSCRRNGARRAPVPIG